MEVAIGRGWSLVFVAAGVAATWAAAACFTGTLPVAASGPVTPRGCAVGDGSAPLVAPNGYYTNGTTVCTAAGTAHLFHGVDRPSLEWDPRGEFAGGEGIPASDFQEMATWHANVVRIALNQDFWLSTAGLYNADYADTVDQAVHDAEAAGLDVILDLHWSDAGNIAVLQTGNTKGAEQNSTQYSDQQQMADVNSMEFWRQLAVKYAQDGHVLFELYNEPNSVSWAVWLNGGLVSTTGPAGSIVTYQVVGMQQLYNTIRTAGANNIVIAGGLNWAFDLSGVGGAPIQGYNIMYATHPYNTADRAPGSWLSSFGYLAAGDVAPVIVTEFGDFSAACTGQWDTELIAYAAQYQISWTAWAWFTGGCSFPALLSDWKYTPTSTSDPNVPGAGQAVKTALAAFPAPVPPTVDAGAEGGMESGAAEAGPDASDGGSLADGDASPVLDGAADDATEIIAEGGASD
jgi:endoglucanase